MDSSIQLEEALNQVDFVIDKNLWIKGKLKQMALELWNKDDDESIKILLQIFKDYSPTGFRLSEAIKNR